MLGLAYKPGVEDVRESPALVVLHHLLDAGADCAYHDDHVPTVNVSRRRAGDHGAVEGAGERLLRSVPLDAETLTGADCVVILTAHPQVDYEEVVRGSSLVFDATGVTRPLRSDSIIRL